jgi:hypothetical protein
MTKITTAPPDLRNENSLLMLSVVNFDGVVVYRPYAYLYDRSSYAELQTYSPRC